MSENTKQKFIKDLRKTGQKDMATFLETNKNPEIDKLIITALEGKRYLVICKTCGKIFVDLPFMEFYKHHTNYEWDLWFCDAVLHWAETEGKHSIYCFSDERNYNISSSLTYDCRNESWKQIHKDMEDVVAMRRSMVNKKGKI